MLPPVVTAPSSQISYHEQRPVIEIAGGSRPATAALQAVIPLALDQSSVAGRLNILMLTGRERMAENLALLAELFGTAIGLTRKKGESTAAFAQRLAEAIAALPLAERVKLEGQLSRALNGVQLRTLLTSLKNPGGADAAKLSILIELARAKERDLAARSVVTSYRQNAAEPRGELPEGHQPEKPANSQTPAATARAPAQQPSATVAAVPLVAGAEMAPAQGGMPASAEESSPAEQPRSEALDGISRSGEATVDAERAEIADAEAEILSSAAFELADDADDSGALRGMLAEPGDAQSLQALLRRSFIEQGVAGDMADTASPAKEQTAAAEAGPDMDTAADTAGDLNVDSGEEYSPRIELRRSGEPAIAERPQTLLVLKGWREVQTLIPPIADDGAEAPGRALVAQAIQAVGKPMAEGDEIEILPRQADAVAEEMKRRGPSLLLPEAPLSEVQDRAVQAARSFPEALLSQWRMLDEQVTAMRLALDLPDGLMQPVVNYLFENEMEEAGKEDEVKRRFDEDSSEGEGDEQQASARDGDEQRQDDEAEERADERQNAESLSADADRANDLYWRMAGWS